MCLPEYFCWTRYGTEAGESFSLILSRKESERRANGGVFLWGIGNALGPSIGSLVQRTARPKVVFSPIRSLPRACDVTPEQVVRWTSGETLSGNMYILPRHSIVTSRATPQSASRSHYALVCHSPRPLKPDHDQETLSLGELRNLLSGRPLGASQVTAVVARNAEKHSGSLYPATLLVDLLAPYFVRLRNPVAVN